MGNDAGLLDPDRIAMLRDLDDGDGELMGILAGEYERDSTEQLAMIQRAVADEDTQTLERAAHTLKGSSANLGAEGVAELCARLQEIGHAGALADAGDLVASVTTELERVHAALRQLLVEA